MPEISFQEQAYKERKAFAEINRLRDVNFSRLITGVSKEMNRVDFGQQRTKVEEAVQFQPSHTLRLSHPRRKLGGIGAGKGKGMFGKPIGAGQKDDSYEVSSLKGSKNTLSAAANWTTEGYSEVKPTVAESQGILPPLPKVPRQKLPGMLGMRGRMTKRPI